MTIYHIEGFDAATTVTGSSGSTDTVNYVNSRYSDADVIAGADCWVEPGHAGQGRCLQLGTDSSSGAHYIAFPLPNASTIWCSYYRRPPNKPNLSANTYFWQIRDATTPQVTFTTNGSLSIIARRGTYTGTILGVSKPALWGGHWTWLKIKVVIHNTAGEIKIWADGELVLDLTSIDTQNTANAYGTSMRIWGTEPDSSLDPFMVDNIIVSSTDPGDWKIVENIQPASSGSNADFTSSGGGSAVYTNVDEIPGDADGTYNYSSTTNDIDSFGVASLSYVTSAIVGLEHRMYARHEGVANSARTKIFSGTAVSNGSTEALTNAYLAYYTISETDPYTSSAWSVAGVESAEIGYENMT